MTHLTVDANVAARLREAEDLADIRDADGNVIGFFAPITSRFAQLYTGVSGRLDPVEIQRRKAAGRKGYTTKEVFQHLQSLTDDPELRAYIQKKTDGLAENEGCATP